MKETQLDYYDRKLALYRRLCLEAIAKEDNTMAKVYLAQGKAIMIAKEKYLKKNPVMSLFGGK